MKNFDRPYLSQSIREFWRRWHISLSSWFTDYIYVPMGGSQKGFFRHIFAVCVVFFVSGLWHGAAWTFVIWGLIHAFYMIVEILIQKHNSKILIPSLSVKANKIRNLIAIIVTYSLVSFAWIFFRAESLPKAFYYIQQLFSAWNLENTLSILNFQFIDVFQLVLIIIILPALNKLTNLPDGKSLTKVKINKLAVTYVFYIMAIGISWLIQLQQNGNNIFIYFQF